MKSEHEILKGYIERIKKIEFYIRELQEEFTVLWFNKKYQRAIKSYVELISKTEEHIASCKRNLEFLEDLREQENITCSVCKERNDKVFNRHQDVQSAIKEYKGAGIK